ncbi:MAG: DUF362 domain-containing protein [Candidatus Riflebacteria bacterium]|nr:DUF362 domain-containing protein [Candidatus Riflebacteria bacterium]
MKVSIQKCKDYLFPELETSLLNLISPFGSISGILRGRKKVLLKPNMLSPQPPEKAITTHPKIVEWLSQKFISAGAEVMIGDSPPLAIGQIENYWNKTGMREVSNKTGARLVYFEKEKSKIISLNGSKKTFTVSVPELIFDPDLVIVNLPKFKTHNLTVITGAIKNFFGLLPGLQKPKLHKEFPLPYDFGKMIASVSNIFKNSFTIMDGITGIDENGPTGGRKIQPGILLASESALALDLVFCAIVGLDPTKIPVLPEASRQNFGPYTLSELELFGETIEEIKLHDFHLPKPSIVSKLPGSMVKLAQRLLKAKPRVDVVKCIRCGACVNVCPASAIFRKADEIKINHSKCIVCFCCTEVCPVNALGISTSPLLGMLKIVRDLKKRIIS